MIPESENKFVTSKVLVVGDPALADQLKRDGCSSVVAVDNYLEVLGEMGNGEVGAVVG